MAMMVRKGKGAVAWLDRERKERGSCRGALQVLTSFECRDWRFRNGWWLERIYRDLLVAVRHCEANFGRRVEVSRDHWWRGNLGE